MDEQGLGRLDPAIMTQETPIHYQAIPRSFRGIIGLVVKDVVSPGHSVHGRGV